MFIPLESNFKPVGSSFLFHRTRLIIVWEKWGISGHPGPSALSLEDFKKMDIRVWFGFPLEPKGQLMTSWFPLPITQPTPSCDAGCIRHLKLGSPCKTQWTNWHTCPESNHPQHIPSKLIQEAIDRPHGGIRMPMQFSNANFKCSRSCL